MAVIMLIVAIAFLVLAYLADRLSLRHKRTSDARASWEYAQVASGMRVVSVLSLTIAAGILALEKML